MISQADIIKTLVNKNCTDESILSMALSPDCTPPKLLEKITESERFDLALDVSMKLGLDALPLWKTWAIRCLKNYNFQAARDKFRHCFQRLRSTTGRASPAASNLLCDILNELCRMNENKLSLSEELELIKNREDQNNRSIFDVGNLQLTSDQPKNPTHGTDTIIQSKPKIYSECLFYLNEYGSVEDHIKFYLGNKLWNLAVKLLLDNRSKINADRYFIIEVVLFTSTNGHLDDVITAFMDQDPEISFSFKYYKAMYNYYSIHRRYNSLYYLQNKLGDYVAAAENQIVHFYLKKPTVSYKELNQRLVKLINASENYRNYLSRLKNEDQRLISRECCTILFANVTRDEAERRIKTIDTQIDITRNFAINEVQGCIHNIEVVCCSNVGADKISCASKDKSNNNSPVTLFDTSESRLTFLTSLVLMYFDVDCTTYFSNSGLNMAIKLINDYKLDKMCVFKTAMRVIIEDESCDIIESANLLLKRIIEDHIASHKKTTKSRRKLSKNIVAREVLIQDPAPSSPHSRLTSSFQTPVQSRIITSGKTIDDGEQPLAQHRLSISLANSNKIVKPGTVESARLLFDEIVSDAIGSCQEQDYKMRLASLLSDESRIELYLGLGKLSNAQRLACDMNRPDYVEMVLKEAEKLNQVHVKDVCQHWLAKH